MPTHDYIIVGSGCTGAMAAQTLVDAGVKVLMLDVSLEDKKYKHIFPEKNFIDIREQEKEQSRYLLGEEFEGVQTSAIKTGAQLTPSRRHLIEKVEELLPIQSGSFFPMESLAYGGLGSGWGVGCCQFSKAEMEKAGLNYHEMIKAYQWVSEHIGISGQEDDITSYSLGELKNYQPALKIDLNAQTLYKAYQNKKISLNKDGFYMGRTALAVITRSIHERKPYAYEDTDFYSDKNESAYRPWITIERLKKNALFQLQNNAFVLSFEEKENEIEVNYYDVATKENKIVRTRKLMLASGPLGTARIVLRSFNAYEHKLPLLCNPYAYIPCIQWRMLGKELEKENSGFSQLSLFHDPDKNNFDVAMASIYSYRSLMLFRIAMEAPLNFYDGRIIMNYLMPAFTIMGIHHPEAYSQGKYLELRMNASTLTKDELKTEYKLAEQELAVIKNREKKYIRAMRAMGCYAIKRVDPGMGSSIHYAGTLPFSKEERIFTLSSDGRLNKTKHVYVADGSGFSYLPAKGLTFSLMANAHNVAKNALKI
jgi:hypothetical protein